VSAAGKSRSGADAERLAVVGELASLINTTFDLGEIFRAAILKLKRVIAFRRASVVLVSADRTEYGVHTLYDELYGGFMPVNGSFPIDKGLTGEAIRTGKALRIEGYEGTQGIRVNGEHNVSVLIVPLRVEDAVIGTLNLGAPEGQVYGEADLELAQLLARPIETSLYYSKLFSTIEQQRGDLSVEHDKVVAERSQLASLIEASQAAILMVTDGKVAHANSVMAELLGLPVEVMLGAPMERINQALARSLANPEALAPQTEALLKGEQLFRDRVELVFPRQLICQRTLAPVRGPEGDVLGHVLIYRDVTAEAEAEDAKDEFVSTVSHELRTPLTSVKTSLSLLGKGVAGEVTDEMREFLGIALRNLERLIRLVDDLLDLSRIESGRLVTNVEPVALARVVTSAVDAVRGFAEVREARLEVTEGEPVTVTADGDRLEQVIVNLLSNAVKFSPAGGRVGLSWSLQDGQAVLEVSDEGPGIPVSQLDAVFERFRQLGDSSSRSGGAGLGLAISRKIIEQFGGSLWVESHEGEGARFFVRLEVTGEATG
jgi:signal transduction histidine kinase